MLNVDQLMTHRENEVDMKGHQRGQYAAAIMKRGLKGQGWKLVVTGVLREMCCLRTWPANASSAHTYSHEMISHVIFPPPFSMEVSASLSTIAGHSLGAGVAALLALKLRHSFPGMDVIGVPGCASDVSAFDVVNVSTCTGNDMYVALIVCPPTGWQHQYH